MLKPPLRTAGPMTLSVVTARSASMRRDKKKSQPSSISTRVSDVLLDDDLSREKNHDFIKNSKWELFTL